jgi:O-antigen/teichoic acid export membrane protein
LITVLGIKGAALAAMCSMLVFNVLKFVFIYKKFNIQPYRRNHIRIILIGVIAYVITVQFIYPEHLILNITLKSMLFGVLFVLLNFLSGTSDDFTDLLKKYIPFLREKSY